MSKLKILLDKQYSFDLSTPTASPIGAYLNSCTSQDFVKDLEEYKNEVRKDEREALAQLDQYIDQHRCEQDKRTDIAVRLMERLMPSMDLTGMGDMATGLITKQIVKLTDSLLKELETTNLNKD